MTAAFNPTALLVFALILFVVINMILPAFKNR